MIHVIDNKYYLYIHVRMDTQQVFYVGIGTQPRAGLLYSRAYVTRGRNRSWVGITSRTHYRVEIVKESDNKQEIIDLEKAMILKYGRRDLRTGTLSNRSNGGEGIGSRTKQIKNASTEYRPKKRT